MIYRAGRGIWVAGQSGLAAARAAAVAGDWWLPAGIDSANCIAAYQPKGAASLAASYVNLANPGTHDLALGDAPSWSAATGWTWDGTADNLLTGITTLAKPVTFAARVNVTDLLAYRAILGANSSPPGGWELRAAQTTGKLQLMKQGVALIGESSSGISAGADTVVAVTYSAGSVFTFYIGGSAAGTGTLNETPAGAEIQIGYYTGEIWKGQIAALAIYDVALDGTQAAALSTAMAAL